MTNALIRAARTYAQTLLGLLIAGWADFENVDAFLDLGSSALVAAIPAALSFLLNALEDHTPVNVGPKG